MSFLSRVPKIVKSKLKKLLSFSPSRLKRENDALYRLLYECIHNKQKSLEFSALQTEGSFGEQWKQLPKGDALLSDPWFKENVTRILCEEELQLSPNWFKGKRVLDAGCGNGRWSYAFAKLGAEVTAVDINESALLATKEALEEFGITKNFIHSPLEQLSHHLPNHSFDLVFSWGVLHHCSSFTDSLKEVASKVKRGGVLYLYLYGRESMPFDVDLELFKQRIFYHTLPSQEDKTQFLLEKANGDTNKLHMNHDIYSPLINRRLTFEEVKQELMMLGFSNIEQTIVHSELFIRCVEGSVPLEKKWLLPQKLRPYWFERYQ